jgi:transcriptional regulator with XRE-family HTH domain
MFNTEKWGAFLSRLRKNKDMTQSELATVLSLTRQAISNYEQGDSFPDITILIQIAHIFKISLDELIGAGDPTVRELALLKQVASGEEVISVEHMDELMALAPLLKPSILTKLTQNLQEKGIDLSHIIALSDYLNDEGVITLLEKANFQANNELLEKLIPLLETDSRLNLFQKILDGEIDWHMVKHLIPYEGYMRELGEAAVVEGVLPWEALTANHEGSALLLNRREKQLI